MKQSLLLSKHQIMDPILGFRSLWESIESSSDQLKSRPYFEGTLELKRLLLEGNYKIEKIAIVFAGEDFKPTVAYKVEKEQP